MCGVIFQAFGTAMQACVLSHSQNWNDHVIWIVIWNDHVIACTLP